MNTLLLLATLALTQTPAPISTSGTWKIVGDVQGVAVAITCTLVEADSKLTGTCGDGAATVHPATGIIKDGKPAWSFPSEYQGTPITLTLAALLDPSGASMKGTIYVPEFQADGTFTASRQPAAMPAATPPPSK